MSQKKEQRGSGADTGHRTAHDAFAGARRAGIGRKAGASGIRAAGGRSVDAERGRRSASGTAAAGSDAELASGAGVGPAGNPRRSVPAAPRVSSVGAASIAHARGTTGTTNSAGAEMPAGAS